MVEITVRPRLSTEDRDLILKRDKYKCQRCDSKLQLEVHHIDHDKTNQSYLNLITLCNICHVEASSAEHKISIEKLCRERIVSTYKYILKEYLGLISLEQELPKKEEPETLASNGLVLYEVRIGEDLFNVYTADNLTARWKAARLFRDKHRLDVNLENIVQFSSTRMPSKPLPILKTTKEVLENLLLKLK